MVTIPKRLFFFWGGSNMSWLRYMTIVSAKKLNPDWKIQLFISNTNIKYDKCWQDVVTQDFFNYKSDINYLTKIEELGVEIIPWILDHPEKRNNKWNISVSPPHKSDFFQWEQLSAEGGIYSDMDILFIKPLDELYNEFSTYDTGLNYDKYFSIGFMLSSSKNKFFYDLFLRAFEIYDKNRYQCTGIETVNALLSNNKCIVKNKFDWRFVMKKNMLQLFKEKYPKNKLLNFKTDTVYPFNYMEMHYLFEKPKEEYISRITNNTLGIHWYAGDSISQKYNNILNENNYFDFDNILIHFVKELDNIK